jgi:hypothetical protein
MGTRNGRAEPLVGPVGEIFLPVKKNFFYRQATLGLGLYLLFLFVPTVVSPAVLIFIPIRVFSLKMMGVIGMKMMKSL